MIAEISRISVSNTEFRQSSIAEKLKLIDEIEEVVESLNGKKLPGQQSFVDERYHAQIYISQGMVLLE